MKLVLNLLFFWSFEIVSNFVLRIFSSWRPFDVAQDMLWGKYVISDVFIVSEFQILLVRVYFLPKSEAINPDASSSLTMPLS